MVINKIKSDKRLDEELKGVLRASGYDINRLQEGKNLVLITGHRREISAMDLCLCVRLFRLLQNDIRMSILFIRCI